jgi:esterase/lipase superfamily enzyme
MTLFGPHGRQVFQVMGVVGAMLLAAPLGGCGTTSLEPSFSAFASTGSVAPSQGRTVPMIVASTRKSDRSGTGEALSQARLSLQTISVPPGHKVGVVERPSFGGENPMNHFVVVGQRGIDPEMFRQELATQLSGRVGASRDVLVYVHGFNTSYDEARYRLAQLVADAKFTGVPVLFTWPSRQKLLAYGSDKESATASRDALEDLLADIAATPGVGRVNVLAHSMGTWLAMEALRQRAIAGQGDLGGKLGEVMLAAPDIDLEVFKAQMARLKGAGHVSILAANDDRALSVSSALAGDRTRLGALDLKNAEHLQAVTDLGVRVYDLSGASVSDFYRHDTFAQAPEVVRSIGGQLAEVSAEGAKEQSQAFVDEETRKGIDSPVAPAASAGSVVTGDALPPPSGPAQR